MGYWEVGFVVETLAAVSIQSLVWGLATLSEEAISWSSGFKLQLKKKKDVNRNFFFGLN